MARAGARGFGVAFGIEPYPLHDRRLGRTLDVLAAGALPPKYRAPLLEQLPTGATFGCRLGQRHECAEEWVLAGAANGRVSSGMWTPGGRSGEWARRGPCRWLAAARWAMSRRPCSALRADAQAREPCPRIGVSGRSGEARRA